MTSFQNPKPKKCTATLQSCILILKTLHETTHGDLSLEGTTLPSNVTDCTESTSGKLMKIVWGVQRELP